MLTAGNYFLGRRRVLYPPFVYSLIWCGVTYLYGLSLIEMDKVDSITWWAIVSGATVFSIGSWIAQLAPKRLLRLRVHELNHRTSSDCGKYLLVAVCVLSLPLLFREILSLGATGGLGLLANTRQATIDIANSGGSLLSYPALTYLPTFSVWVTILLFMEGGGKSTLFRLAVAVAVVCCLLATGRGLFLMLVSGLTYLYLFNKKDGSIRTAFRIALVPLLVFSSIFVGIIFINKNLTSFSGGVSGFFAFFILGYILGPLGGLNYVLTHPAQFASEPHRTFEFFLKVFSALSGISFQPPQILDKFAFVPFPVNVYTLYKPLFTDFGFAGMLLAVFFIGLIQTVVYLRAREGGKIALFFSALLIYSSVMSIFDDAYTDFQHMILAIVLLALYYGILNRIVTGISPRFPVIRLPRIRISMRKAL